MGWLAVVLGLCLLSLFTQLSGIVAACSPKLGMVVDAATGKGMPNVFVMASASFEAGPLVHGSSHKALYNVIARTDSNGNYAIPSQYLHFALGFPGTNPTITWIVTAFAPGYAVIGDEDGWRTDENGDAFFWARSTSESPASKRSDGYLIVEPIQLRSVKLSLPEAAAYYRKLLAVGFGRDDAPEPNEVQARQRAHDFFTPWICSESPDLAVDMRTARYLMIFGVAERRSEERLKEIDPAKWGSLSYSGALPYSAVQVCDALRAGE